MGVNKGIHARGEKAELFKGCLALHRSKRLEVVAVVRADGDPPLDLEDLPDSVFGDDEPEELPVPGIVPGSPVVAPVDPVVIPVGAEADEPVLVDPALAKGPVEVVSGRKVSAKRVHVEKPQPIVSVEDVDVVVRPFYQNMG